MAELIASELLEKLGRDRSFKNSEISLRNELDLLNRSIEEKDRKLEKQGSSKVWVKGMREVSALIEDVIDEYYAFSPGSFAFVNYLSRAGGLIVGRGDVASNIKMIKALLLDIKEIPRNPVFERHTYRQQIDYPSKDEFLQGISPLVGVLMYNYLVGREPAYSAVAVLGAEGIGKTTFAKVYDDEVVRKHFDCCAWIMEPPTPNIHEVINSVAKQICNAKGRIVEDIDGMSFAEIVRTMRRFLQSKRYLLVFDDVSKVELWHVMKEALPDDNNGSRIIIITGNERVALACKESPRTPDDKVEPLSEEMARDLLLSTVFRRDQESHFNSELQLLCHEIIRMCQDFPLAIIVVAGLLLPKEKVPHEWRKLIENFSCDVKPIAHLWWLSNILALDFLDLPHQLKSCFLYFSIFPRESLIPNDKLFKLWIAEGFVQEKEGKTLEEVAQEYLDGLIERNLVQSREGFYGIEKFSQVHCLMHEILDEKAIERRFCQIWGVEDSSFKGKSRRLLISNHDVEIVLETIEESQVRSVFLSNVSALNNSVLVRLFEKYKLLTLLDVENSPLEVLPEEVGNLLCLKYLSLKNTRVRKLPKSIGKLRKLQTLDLTRTLLVELPMEIFKLHNLQHLLASRCDNKISLDSAKGVRMKAGLRYLVYLQTLMTVEAHLSGMDVIQELKRLRQLRSLSVSRLTTELASALCSCIEVMSLLKSLRLHSMNYQSLDLHSISSAPPHLERLVLKGSLQNFPDWISSLQNLSMLCLSLSRLSDDPLVYLCHLPNLESLWLYRAYEGEKLHFQEGSFKQLKLLVLRELQGLEAVEIEEHALPLLEELRIGPSPLLNEVPSGIKHLRNLKIISFYDMPNEFLLSMKPDGGSEYSKVKHVLSVLIWYKEMERCYISYQLGQADLWQSLEGTNTNINDSSQSESRLSFCYSDDEEDSASTSNVQWNDIPQWSNISSDRFSFFTDDIEY